MRKIFVVKILILTIILGIFVAGAIPRYINLNKHTEASQCRRNQAIVEAALAIAYAESLSNGGEKFPSKLTESMFDDGIIPVCPIDHTPIAFDSLTGTAYCPHQIKAHRRIY